jgi:hypothetical protein
VDDHGLSAFDPTHEASCEPKRLSIYAVNAQPRRNVEFCRLIYCFALGTIENV